MTIREATITDLEVLVPLFDGYRQFYRQVSDLQKGKKFLEERISRNESVIYIAFAKAKPIGFTQLYPIFSSVSMEPIYLLNDLFILPEYREKGIGTALINVVKERCKIENQKGIALQTEPTNPAQKLYEHLGFKKDPDLHYFWTLK
jgi:GNAT superfamily N-acetyltransferase